MASINRCFGVLRSTTSRPTGDMKAAATPCRARAAMKVHRFGLSAHSSEDSVNRPMAPANRLRAPKRSLAQPRWARSRQRHQVGRDAERQGERGRAEAGRDGRQRGGDDGAVQRLHEERRGHDERDAAREGGRSGPWRGGGEGSVGRRRGQGGFQWRGGRCMARQGGAGGGPSNIAPCPVGRWPGAGRAPAGSWCGFCERTLRSVDNRVLQRCDPQPHQEPCHAACRFQPERWRRQVHHHLQPGRHQRQRGPAHAGGRPRSARQFDALPAGRAPPTSSRRSAGFFEQPELQLARRAATDFIVETPFENLDLMPSSPALDEMQGKLESRHKIYKLREALASWATTTTASTSTRRRR